jgi:FAD synthetase
MTRKGRVLATGVFNILHPGHLFYLGEAKRLGDELYVIVARDVNVRKPFTLPEQQRLEIVKALRLVDKAILGSKKDIFEPLQKIKPDVIALGYDQKFDEKELEKELRKRGLKARVVRIRRFKGDYANSTKIISWIKKYFER